MVITHRDGADGASEVLASLDGDGHRVIQVSATDSAGLDEAAASVAETEGRLDVLVINAARTKVIPHRDLDASDDALFDLVMSTNVRGPFATVRAFRGLLAAGPGGVAVNISSIASFLAMGSNVVYAGSMASLDNMTRSLARASVPEIGVVSVAPGLVGTEVDPGLVAGGPSGHDRRNAKLVNPQLVRNRSDLQGGIHSLAPEDSNGRCRRSGDTSRPT